MVMDSSIEEELKELAGDYKHLEAASRTYLEKLEELSDHQKKCQKHISHQRYRMGVLAKQLNKLKTSKKEDPKKIEDFENHMLKRSMQLFQIEQTLPKRSGIYLRIILGNVNVSILNKEDKFKYKDEYEKFKLIICIIGILLGFLNLTVHFRPFELILMFVLVWYYCTLTIRESILVVNGSRIKGWWRVHHFLMTVAAAIFLIWPDTATWSAFRDQFMAFNVYVGCVQYLQFLYQRGQLYRMKALGQKHNMDVTIEGFQSWMWRGLGFLLPFLILAYVFQFYNAYTLYLLSFEPSATWHVPVLALLFLVLFLGNSSTTLTVLLTKLKERMVLRYHLMSQKIGFVKNMEIHENASEKSESHIKSS